MDEVIKKYDDMANAKKFSQLILGARIGWFVFAFIVINPLIKSLLNPNFSWSGVVSIDYVTRQFPLFILILFNLLAGLATPFLVRKFLAKKVKAAQYFISFVLQLGFFVSVPVIGFVVAQQEDNPSLVFFYAAIGMMLLLAIFPTRKRWYLTPEEEQAFIAKTNEPIKKNKKEKIIKIISLCISIFVLLQLAMSFFQKQKAKLANAEQCQQDCATLFTNGELQPGVTAEMCIEKSCK